MGIPVENVEPSATPDAINRLWQHGLHEERLFHDRLNYFSFLETGFLTICVIMYNKDQTLGLHLPLYAVGLVFTILWVMIQRRHWAYCVHVNERIRQVVPEYKLTTGGFSAGGYRDGLSISKPLALSVPMLFACTWIAFIVWLVLRPMPIAAQDGIITVERIVLAILMVAVIWLLLKLKSVERKLIAAISRINVTNPQ